MRLRRGQPRRAERAKEVFRILYFPYIDLEFWGFVKSEHTENVSSVNVIVDMRSDVLSYVLAGVRNNMRMCWSQSRSGKAW